MKRNRSLFCATVAGAALLAACGGAPAKEPAPAAKLDVPRIATPAETRSASEALRRRWPFDDRARVALYVDVETMAKMDLFRALASSAPEPCIAEVFGAMRELAIGGDERGSLVLARFGKVPEPALRACVAAMADEKATLAIDGDVAAFGPRDLVAASARGRADAWPAELSLKGDAIAAWTARVDQGVNARGGIFASSERFRADARADVPEELAQMLEERLAKGAALGPLARAFKLERKGGAVELSFELREPPVDQARDLGTLAALATHGVRAYLTRAKTAEARSTVGAIARAYVTEWETERGGGPRAKRKLRSYPAVPKAVPRGTATASKGTDWAAWKDLRFELEGTQRYQYEIVAAKDGESAEILARGDLNGDGKTSVFRIRVKVDRAKDVLVVSPSIEEVDPDE